MKPAEAVGPLDGRIGLERKVAIAILIHLHPLAALVGDVIGGWPADWVLCPRPSISQHHAFPFFVEEDPYQITLPRIPVRSPMIPSRKGLQYR
jgi:hypothetical protein